MNPAGELSQYFNTRLYPVTLDMRCRVAVNEKLRELSQLSWQPWGRFDGLRAKNATALSKPGFVTTTFQNDKIKLMFTIGNPNIVFPKILGIF
jgi:hypothetical protein